MSFDQPVKLDSRNVQSELIRPLSENEIERIALRQSVFGSNLHTVMTYFKNHYWGRYDPKIAVQIVRRVI